MKERHGRSRLPHFFPIAQADGGCRLVSARLAACVEATWAWLGRPRQATACHGCGERPCSTEPRHRDVPDREEAR